MTDKVNRMGVKRKKKYHGVDDGKPRTDTVYGDVSDQQKQAKKPTIAELEAMLHHEEQNDIEILPNGEIRAVTEKRAEKPLTLRENLGGEYAEKPEMREAEAVREIPCTKGKVACESTNS